MPLNKNKQDNLKTALFYLKGGFKDKPEISETTNNIAGVDIVIREKTPAEIRENAKSMNMDEDLLRGLADQVLIYLKDYPKLKRELKEKYFKDLPKIWS